MNITLRSILSPINPDFFSHPLSLIRFNITCIFRLSCPKSSILDPYELKCHAPNSPIADLQCLIRAVEVVWPTAGDETY
jgi:hypothetical protein